MTDGRTDGRTDRRTFAILESLSRLKRLYMRTFSMIPDPKHKIFQDIFVLDWGPDFHPNYFKCYYYLIPLSEATGDT